MKGIKFVKSNAGMRGHFTKIAESIDSYWLKNEIAALSITSIQNLSQQIVLNITEEKNGKLIVEIEGPICKRNKDILFQLGTKLNTIHNIRGDGFCWSILGKKFSSKTEWIEEWLDRKNERTNIWITKHRPEVLNLIENSIVRSKEQIIKLEDTPVLCHGDIRIGNIGSNSGNLVLIDWEFCHFGCAARDIARCWSILDSDSWANFIKLYTNKYDYSLLVSWSILDCFGSLSYYIKRNNSRIAMSFLDKLIRISSK